MKMGRHTWLMMICCAIPVAGIILPPVPGLRLGGFWPLIFVLAFPLSMLSAARPAPGPRVLSSPPGREQGH